MVVFLWSPDLKGHGDAGVKSFHIEGLKIGFGLKRESICSAWNFWCEARKVVNPSICVCFFRRKGNPDLISGPGFQSDHDVGGRLASTSI